LAQRAESIKAEGCALPPLGRPTGDKGDTD
jgi:hypothetical protein